MDRAIYGDNQFFGVNHYSEGRASERAERFRDDESIYRTLCLAHEIGVRSFMFTTYGRLDNVFAMMRKDPRFDDFKLIPCLPYAHKYADAMTEAGVVGAMWKYMPRNVVALGCRALRGLLTSDPAPVLRSLIDTELRAYRGLNVEAVFLQNIPVDFALGLGMHHLFGEFADYVERRYQARPGFLTMNHVLLEETLRNKVGIERPLICSSINAIGFRMNPGKAAVEDAIKQQRSQVIAMSVLASGALAPVEALDYINGLDGVCSVVFGASSKANIEQTFNLIMQGKSQHESLA
jgi:hypothetical protein